MDEQRELAARYASPDAVPDDAGMDPFLVPDEDHDGDIPPVGSDEDGHSNVIVDPDWGGAGVPLYRRRDDWDHPMLRDHVPDTLHRPMFEIARDTLRVPHWQAVCVACEVLWSPVPGAALECWVCGRKAAKPGTVAAKRARMAVREEDGA